MKKGICYIVGAGDWFEMDFRPAENDFVIAADAGLRYLEQVGIPADLVIGDFDTLEEIPTGANVVRLSCEKDDTDMLAAVRGTGGRIDHTLANLQVLAYLAGNGMQGFLHCPQNVLLRPVDKKLKNCGYNKMPQNTPKQESVITAITDGELSFLPVSYGYISVFSYSEKAEGVYLQGLKYPLENAALTNTFPIGTSNEFIGKKSRIAVKSGTLMVVFPKEAKEKMIC